VLVNTNFFTAELYSLYVKESESEIFERLESEILERPESGVGNFKKVGVGHFTSDSATLLVSTIKITKSRSPLIFSYFYVFHELCFCVC